MKTLSQHIEHIQSKPHHVRKQVAFGIAGVSTALIALMWLTYSVNTGVFALKDTSFEDSAKKNITPVKYLNNNAQLAGVAASEGKDKNSEPAYIEIVNKDLENKAPVKQVEQTIIPF